jgi:hypothetical protein
MCNITIPSTSDLPDPQEPGKTFIVYNINITHLSTNRSSSCSRRFHEFREFDRVWGELYPTISERIKLPSTFAPIQTKSTIDKRRKKLEDYLMALAEIKAVQPLVAQFLGVTEDYVCPPRGKPQENLPDLAIDQWRGMEDAGGLIHGLGREKQNVSDTQTHGLVSIEKDGETYFVPGSSIKKTYTLDEMKVKNGINRGNTHDANQRAQREKEEFLKKNAGIIASLMPGRQLNFAYNVDRAGEVNDRYMGRVHLSLWFRRGTGGNVRPQTLSDGFEDVGGGALVIEIHSGMDLPSYDGITNPYCKLYFLPDPQKISKKKTSSKQRTVNPTWEEVFEYKGIYPNELFSHRLVISIWDRRSTAKNHCVGQVVVKDLMNLPTTPQTKLSRYVELSPWSEFAINDNLAISVNDMAAASSTQTVQTPTPRPAGQIFFPSAPPPKLPTGPPPKIKRPESAVDNTPQPTPAMSPSPASTPIAPVAGPTPPVPTFSAAANFTSSSASSAPPPRPTPAPRPAPAPATPTPAPTPPPMSSSVSSGPPTAPKPAVVPAGPPAAPKPVIIPAAPTPTEAPVNRPAGGPGGGNLQAMLAQRKAEMDKDKANKPTPTPPVSKQPTAAPLPPKPTPSTAQNTPKPPAAGAGAGAGTGTGGPSLADMIAARRAKVDAASPTPAPITSTPVVNPLPPRPTPVSTTPAVTSPPPMPKATPTPPIIPKATSTPPSIQQTPSPTPPPMSQAASVPTPAPPKPSFANSAAVAQFSSPSSREPLNNGSAASPPVPTRRTAPAPPSARNVSLAQETHVPKLTPTSPATSSAAPVVTQSVVAPVVFAKPPPPKPSGNKFVVVLDYSPSNDEIASNGLLPLVVGQFVNVIDKSDEVGWWYGMIGSKEGYFPGSYVKLA